MVIVRVGEGKRIRKESRVLVVGDFRSKMSLGGKPHRRWARWPVRHQVFPTAGAHGNFAVFFFFTIRSFLHAVLEGGPERDSYGIASWFF